MLTTLRKKRKRKAGIATLNSARTLGSAHTGSEKSKEAMIPIVPEKHEIMELMDGICIPELPVDWHWFCNHAELFKKVDKKTSKELSDRHECEVKGCYHNTFMSDVGGRYRYFEGYVLDKRLPLITGHSWLVDRMGNVIDPTLIIDIPKEKYGKAFKNRCGECYIGIEIPRNWLNKTAFKLKRTGDFMEMYQKEFYGGKRN